MVSRNMIYDTCYGNVCGVVACCRCCVWVLGEDFFPEKAPIWYVHTGYSAAVAVRVAYCSVTTRGVLAVVSPPPTPTSSKAAAAAATAAAEAKLPYPVYTVPVTVVSTVLY